jgi:hypothetical protein
MSAKGSANKILFLPPRHSDTKFISNRYFSLSLGAFVADFSGLSGLGFHTIFSDTDEYLFLF